MGKTRMEEPTFPHQGIVEGNGSVETPSRHTSGTDGARPKQGALARREYGLLAPSGTAADPADAGNPGSEAFHRATGEKDGGESEEEEDETQHRALPACGSNVIGDNGRGLPERSRALNAGGRQGDSGK